MKDSTKTFLFSGKENPIRKGEFYNPTKGRLKLENVLNEVLGYIAEKTDSFYEIIVGCDSSSGLMPHFPVAIVVLRVGEGGRFFLKKINYKDRKFYSWKERIIEEVLISCELALQFKEKLEERAKEIKGNYRFCYIHADVGENGGTKDMIKEVVGLIRGNGFEPKIKPDSYVASTLADKYA